LSGRHALSAIGDPMSRRTVWSIALSVVAIVLLATVAVARLGGVPPDVGGRRSSDAVLVGSKIVVIDDVAISVASAKPVDASEGLPFGPAKGNRYLVVEVRLENRGTGMIETPESGTFSLKTADGAMADYAPVPLNGPAPPVAFVGKGSYSVLTGFEVPIKGRLTFLMEPNSVSDRIVEIPLVPIGGPGPETETIKRTETATGDDATMQPAMRQAAIGGPIDLSACTFNVLSCGPWRSDAQAVYLPNAGRRFIGVRVRVRSTSAGYFTAWSENVRLQDGSGAQWGIVAMDNQAPDVADEGAITIRPGVTEDFTIPFEVPVGAKGLCLVILPGEGWSADQVEVPLGQ
jgi:hypothetical protein